MFKPNLVGVLLKVAGRDIHAREKFAEPVRCPFAQVTLTRSAVRTTVRADSSGSRGAADETTADAKILIVPYIKPENGDRFEFLDLAYKIVGVHPRRGIDGQLDHYECDMEALPV